MYQALLIALVLSVFPLNFAAENVASASEKKFRVTLLGTGTPFPSIRRFGPAILVEAASKKLLFDSGRGVTRNFFSEACNSDIGPWKMLPFFEG